ncbi:hypothetical protein N8T08_007704 [Aspergillus melleus]|uniref:Uncharacterized protein n=1 Tax=Aspergillus melleus TaxID=138277 RepID=A0ACC3BEY3_9EURO|nr:hypothetical protein N8T08_007704 [Aspergillus melleus]
MYNKTPRRGGRIYKTGDLASYNADGGLTCTVLQLSDDVDVASSERAWREAIASITILRTRIVDLSVQGTFDPEWVPTLKTLLVGGEVISPTELQKCSSRMQVVNIYGPAKCSVIDRRWLRDRVTVLSQAEIELYRRPATAKCVPATAAERMLQQLWARVLNILPESIGLEDSFFRLGGDSIAAMQVSARVQASGYSLNVGDILWSKTIGQLSKFLATRTPLVLETQESIGGTFGLSPIQTLFLQLEPHGPNYFNHSFLVPLAAQIDFEDLSRAIHRITFTDRSPPTIFNEGHGRESWDSTIDLSRTVGRFTTIWLTFMEMGSDRDNLVEVVRWTKDARRRASSIGWKDFAARLLGRDRERSFESYGPVEIAFNYLGRYQQFEREDALLHPPISWKDQPPDVAADVGRFALIDVVAVVEQGRLQFSFTWGDYMEHQDKIDR